MREELDRKLCDEFPGIFRDRNAPVTETPMGFGPDVGDGWYDLVRDVCRFIDNALDNARSSVIYEYKAANKLDYMTDLPPAVLETLNVGRMAVVAEQVKEKYGGLRFYWRGEHLPERTHNEVSGAVSMAEMRSYKICEACGERGQRNENGWLSVRCVPCREAKK